MSIRRYILPLILCLALVATGCRSQRDAAGRTPGDNDAATGVGVLSGIEVMDGSGDVVTGISTVVLNESIPSGVDFQTLGNQAVVTLAILLST